MEPPLNTILLRFEAPDGLRDVVLEDDGVVAYAYLREQGHIRSDVWLYNVGESPAVPDWEGSATPPFRNPKPFARENDLGRISETRAVVRVWSEDGVQVSIDGIVWAELERGAKPGRSRLAVRDGPLALVFVRA